MLSCQEVAKEIACDGLEGASWGRQLRVKLHLLLCHHCRRYARQLRAVGLTFRKLCEECEPDEEDLQRLEQSILGEIDEKISPDCGRND